MKVITAPAKRGRKPVERQPIDHGTDQLRLRRILAVGPEADPALASTPLGIMLAHNLIDLDQHAAGEAFRSLYGSASGFARTVGLDVSGWSGSEESLERVTAQFRALAGHLLGVGRNVLQQVVDVAVYDITPYWLRLGLAKNDDRYWKIVKQHGHVDYADLRTGLTETHKILGRRY